MNFPDGVGFANVFSLVWLGRKKLRKADLGTSIYLATRLNITLPMQIWK